MTDQHPFLDENTPPENYENVIPENAELVEVSKNQNPELDEEV